MLRTIMHVNGKKVSDELPDIGFYNALLKTWLGDKPVDAQLKPLMLGEKLDTSSRGNNS